MFFWCVDGALSVLGDLDVIDIDDVDVDDVAPVHQWTTSDCNAMRSEGTAGGGHNTTPHIMT